MLFSFLHIWSSSVCLLTESANECQASRKWWTVIRGSYLLVVCFLFMLSCSMLSSSSTDVVLLAVPTFDLVDNVSFVFHYEHLFWIWNKHSHCFSWLWPLGVRVVLQSFRMHFWCSWTLFSRWILLFLSSLFSYPLRFALWSVLGSCFVEISWKVRFLPIFAGPLYCDVVLLCWSHTGYFVNSGMVGVAA